MIHIFYVIHFTSEDFYLRIDLTILALNMSYSSCQKYVPIE